MKRISIALGSILGIAGVFLAPAAAFAFSFTPSTIYHAEDPITCTFDGVNADNGMAVFDSSGALRSNMSINNVGLGNDTCALAGVLVFADPMDGLVASSTPNGVWHYVATSGWTLGTGPCFDNGTTYADCIASDQYLGTDIPFTVDIGGTPPAGFSPALLINLTDASGTLTTAAQFATGGGIFQTVLPMAAALIGLLIGGFAVSAVAAAVRKSIWASGVAGNPRSRRFISKHRNFF